MLYNLLSFIPLVEWLDDGFCHQEHGTERGHNKPLAPQPNSPVIAICYSFRASYIFKDLFSICYDVPLPLGRVLFLAAVQNLFVSCVTTCYSFHSFLVLKISMQSAMMSPFLSAEFFFAAVQNLFVSCVTTCLAEQNIVLYTPPPHPRPSSFFLFLLDSSSLLRLLLFLFILTPFSFSSCAGFVKQKKVENVIF
jgi:hypothetical protein